MTIEEMMIEICKRAGIVCFTYSGRGMYGKYCLALSVSNEFCAGVTLYKTIKEDGTRFEQLREFVESYSPRSDSLGYDTVLYWPRLDNIPQGFTSTSEDDE